MKKHPAKAKTSRTSGASIIQANGFIVPVGSHEGKTVHVGADHRGFRLKKALVTALRRRGWKVVDEGTRSPARTDYPIWITKVARAVGRSGGRTAAGIGVCGSGIGISIAPTPRGPWPPPPRARPRIDDKGPYQTPATALQTCPDTARIGW